MPYYVSDVNPDYTAALGLFQHLNTEDLRQLLNDEGRVESMVKDLQQVKNAEAEREMLLASNKSLAEFNLSREPKLRQSRQQVQELYSAAAEIKQEVEQKKQKLEGKSHLMSLETTLALLQTSAAESEEETEKIASSFLDGSLSVESFLDEFLDKRKVAHLRRIKAEKMVELLTRRNARSTPQHRSAAVPSRPAPPPPSVPYPAAPYFFPHPQGHPQPMSMPMPMPFS